MFTIFKHMYIFPLFSPLQSHLRPSRKCYSRLCRCWSRSVLYVNTAAMFFHYRPHVGVCVVGGGGRRTFTNNEKLPLLPLSPHIAVTSHHTTCPNMELSPHIAVTSHHTTCPNMEFIRRETAFASNRAI